VPAAVNTEEIVRWGKRGVTPEPTTPKERVLSTKDDPIEKWKYQERLSVKMLLSDLSARFINLPADQVDSAIEYAQ
jgi:hypothetical protein